MLYCFLPNIFSFFETHHLKHTVNFKTKVYLFPKSPKQTALTWKPLRLRDNLRRLFLIKKVWSRWSQRLHRWGFKHSENSSKTAESWRSLQWQTISFKFDKADTDDLKYQALAMDEGWVRHRCSSRSTDLVSSNNSTWVHDVVWVQCEFDALECFVLCFACIDL